MGNVVEDEGEWPESKAVDYRYFRPRRNIWSTLLVPALMMMAFVVFANSYFFKQEKVLDRAKQSTVAASTVKTSESDFFAHADLATQVERLTRTYLHFAAAVSGSPGSTVAEQFDGILADYRSSEDVLRNASRLKSGDFPVTPSIRSLLDSSNSNGVGSGPIPVFFAITSTGLTPPARQSIESAVVRWRQKPRAAVSVEGFADPSGGAGVNQKLSDGRADAVYQALVVIIGGDHVAKPIPKPFLSKKKPVYQSYDDGDPEYQRVAVISVD